MFRTALRFMRFDRPKSIGIVVGIVVSIFLIGQQLGTLKFIVEIMSGLINNANPQSGEIWVIENTSGNVNEITNLDSRFLREIRSVEGVENTYPIVIANSKATMQNGKTIPFVLIGSDAPLFAAGPDTSKIHRGQRENLSNPSAVSVDYYDAKSLKMDIHLGTNLEINGKQAKVVLETKNAQAFGGHYMFTSLNNVRYFSGFPASRVSIIVVKAKANANIKDIIHRINHTFYGVKAWEKNDLSYSTAKELLSATNMGMSFGMLVIFAIVTGFFIIGLTLYSSVLDRQKDYATYKAIGASNGYVRRLILTQALIYAIIGFGFALLLLIFFKQGVANVGLIISLSPELLAFLLLVTLFISIGGSLFAIRKINKLEPASVFK
ncbi:MAG: FtsX-like permease family protein [Chitinophagales bacterium]|nr:FtsX-like permease family protein [Chitinophagales bacterium]